MSHARIRASTMRTPRLGSRFRSRLRRGLLATLIIVLGVAVWALLLPARRPAFPSPDGAVAASDTRSVVARLATAERVGVTDLAFAFAPSQVARFELLIDGPSFYPRILDDLRAARSSIHIVQYGIRPGEVVGQYAPVLKEKAAQGVAVRLIVDQLGSGLDVGNGALFDDLAASGVQVVRNDPLALDRDGLLGTARPLDWRQDELAHLDHRKFFVVDGRVGWIGGAGLEDHFLNGTFHDVYARVEGEAVSQLQAIFLTSFRLLGGSLPTDDTTLSALLPVPDESGQIRTTVLHNVPGAGHLANTDAIAWLIEGAERRIDVMSPYSADAATFRRLIAAARRGVQVRFVAPARSNVWATDAALAHWYADFQAAGVEVWEHPTLPHAKVVLADDRVLIGTTNLDGWALYRNWEAGLLFEDAAVAETVRRDLFDRDVEVLRPATPTTNPLLRARNWVMALLSPLL